MSRQGVPVSVLSSTDKWVKKGSRYQYFSSVLWIWSTDIETPTLTHLSKKNSKKQLRFLLIFEQIRCSISSIRINFSCTVNLIQPYRKGRPTYWYSSTNKWVSTDKWVTMLRVRIASTLHHGFGWLTYPYFSTDKWVSTDSESHRGGPGNGTSTDTETPVYTRSHNSKL